MLFWKIYAWIFAILSVGGNVSLLAGYPPGSPRVPITPTDLLQGLVNLFGLVPVFLLAYKKRFLNPSFWKIFFLLFISLELKDVIFFNRWEPYGPYLFFGLILTLPSYLAIFLYAFRFFKYTKARQISPFKEEEKKEDFVRIYTTNNEHEAELIRIGLEGGGLKVILQRKGDAEAPNSFIHKLEIFVLAKDKEKAIEFLSRSRS